MSKFNKLSRAEMKSVLGGLRDPGLPGGPVGGGGNDPCIKLGEGCSQVTEMTNCCDGSKCKDDPDKNYGKCIANVT